MLALLCLLLPRPAAVGDRRLLEAAVVFTSHPAPARPGIIVS